MSRTRKKEATTVRAPRKRRRRRTRAQIHADLATAQKAIETIFEDESEQTYDALALRLSAVQSDIAARISVVNERWTRDGEELTKLKKIEIVNIIN